MMLKWKKNAWGRFLGLVGQLLRSVNHLCSSSNIQQTIKGQTEDRQAKEKLLTQLGDCVCNERDEAKIGKKPGLEDRFCLTAGIRAEFGTQLEGPRRS